VILEGAKIYSLFLWLLRDQKVKSKSMGGASALEAELGEEPLVLAAVVSV
jgi:hypothetical protein